MRFWAAGFCALFLAGAGFAADEPLIGPAPEWVEETPVPQDVDSAPGQGGVSVLLWDEQYRFSRNADEIYVRTATRIDTPQGLQTMTVLGAAWRPDSQTVTFHHVQIVRDGETIDLLEGGRALTTLRRETNLEYAILDGTLTAIMQPEGLRVGDIVDYAYTVESADPVLQGFSQGLTGGVSTPTKRHRISAEWEADANVSWRATGEFLDIATERRRGDLIVLTLDQQDAVPFEAPANAPTRFLIGPTLQFSNFESWRQVSALFAPLYARAAQMEDDSPLHVEVERIRAAHSDPREQAAAALRLVQEQVRYLALAMDEGGLVPATADETWSRRFGDCKGKTALLLALLHGLNIEAEAVAVDALTGDTVADRLPMIGTFNHVIVRATIDGNVYWLDGTRTGDRSLEDLTTPLFYWGLPLTAEGSELTPIIPEPATLPQSEIQATIDFSEGAYAGGHVEAVSVLRGDAAIITQQMLARATAAEIDEAYRQMWRSYFSAIEIENVASVHNDATSEHRITMTGTLPDAWSDRQYIGIVNSPLFASLVGENDDSRQAPYAMAFPLFISIKETVVLPADDHMFALRGASVADTIGGIEVTRASDREDNIVTLSMSVRTLRPEITVDEGARIFALRENIRTDPLRIVMQSGYQNTPADQEAIANLEANTVDEHIRLGNVHLDTGNFDAAIASFSAALSMDPENGWALANLGLAKIWDDQLEAGEADLTSARAINDENPVVYRGLGLLAVKRENPVEAITYLDRAIELDRNSAFSYWWRAQAFTMAGDPENARRDMARYYALNPPPRWAQLLAFAIPLAILAIIVGGIAWLIFALRKRRRARKLRLQASLATEPTHV